MTTKRQRVVVFFDWQNVYMRAREAFHEPIRDPPYKGQVDPIDLAHVLCDKHAARFPAETFELAEIRIYRGRPTQQAQPGAYAAFQRQTARWKANAKVRPHFNDLRYPDDWGKPTCTDAAREKGIDVALAVDLVTMAHDNAYDVAIVMSADYDLVPAIKHVYIRRMTKGTGPLVEVAAWESAHDGKPLRIRLPENKLWCTWLKQEDYWGVQDDQDYTIASPAQPSKSPGPRPGAWLSR